MKFRILLQIKEWGLQNSHTWPEQLINWEKQSLICKLQPCQSNLTWTTVQVHDNVYYDTNTSRTEQKFQNLLRLYHMPFF